MFIKTSEIRYPDGEIIGFYLTMEDQGFKSIVRVPRVSSENDYEGQQDYVDNCHGYLKHQIEGGSYESWQKLRRKV